MPSCDNSSEYTSFDVLAAEVAIALPDVADPIVKAALVRASMKVVDKAKLIEHKVTQDFFSGVDDYPIQLPDCLSVLNVSEVKVNGINVNYTVDGTWVILDDPYCNIADTKQGLEISVFTGLSRSACELPTAIYERYGEVIINRTLSVLYGMHGHPWYDVGLVKFYGGIAEGGISQAKQDKLEQDIPDGIMFDRGSVLI